LESIAGQDVLPGRVIVVDGGESVAEVVRRFEGRIPVEYYECRPPGQIRQRNLGRAQVRDTDRLVGSLDDDLVLEPGALSAMAACWNRVEPETAGIGFNIVNAPPHRYSRLFGLILMDGPIQGRVLASGANVTLQNVPRDIRTQFLGGGYTIWRKNVLDENPQATLDTRWAHGEDLRFSYPIGKKHPLWVAAGARVRHEHVYDQAPPAEVFRYRGRILSLACFYFVQSNPELSRLACLWMVAGSALARLALALGTWNPGKFQFARGQVEALGIYLRCLTGRSCLEKALSE
jgi:glycosyltransferase involved in cell wall biosynthesis